MAQPTVNPFNTSGKSDEQIANFNPETADENDINDFINIVKSEDKEVKKALKTLNFIYNHLEFKIPTEEEKAAVSDIALINVQSEWTELKNDMPNWNRLSTDESKNEALGKKKKKALERKKKAIVNYRRKKVYILYLLNELRKTDSNNLLKKNEIEYNDKTITLRYNAYQLQDLWLNEQHITDYHNLLYNGKTIGIHTKINEADVEKGPFGGKGLNLGKFDNSTIFDLFLKHKGGKKSRKNRNKSNRKNKSKKTKKANRKTKKNKRA